MHNTTQDATHALMSSIYADIHQSALIANDPNNSTPTSGMVKAKEIIQSIVDNYFSKNPSSETKAQRRYSKFVSTYGWMILAMCAHSEGFAFAANHSNDTVWDSVCRSVTANARSIELFSKLRGLYWQNVLLQVDEEDEVFTKDARETYNIEYDDPFHWYVGPCEVLRQPIYKGHPQESLFENVPRRRAPYNDDTLARILASGPCMLCLATNPCNCSLTLPNSYFVSPLVELIYCGDRGIGIRALQPISAGRILGEYIGEFYPMTLPEEELRAIDPTYALTQTAPSTCGPGPDIGVIDASRYGNWTRFMNHSCRPAAEFFSASVAQRLGMFARASRTIEMFEEITVDYGVRYMECMECNCGEAICKSKKKKKSPVGAKNGVIGEKKP